MEEIQIKDPSIRQFIVLKANLHSGGHHAKQQSKSQISVVERLINRLMRQKRNTGKKQMATRTVHDAFDLIHRQTKQNPLQILVDAISNAGPREEIVRLRYGGIAVPKAVDTSAQRRVDQALMYLAQGAQKGAFKSKRSLPESLAGELIAAAKFDVKTFAISRKEEKERMAKAAR
ncbi:MAG: 30S ribosomal protein S7 [Euryarchaeota archaeon]|nr:30S ribosomal protein S7 [Euryarchaeota archaeon]